MPVEKDPNDGLAADATLASDLPPENERIAAQTAAMGGEVDDIDNYDPSGLDDGSDLDFKPIDDDDDGDADDEGADADKDKDADKDDDDDDDDKDAEDDEAGERDDEADGDDADADDADVDDDAEGESDGDSDEDDDDESESPEAQKPKTGIPKRRFDEVNERRKAAEQENADLRAQIAAAKIPGTKDKDTDKPVPKFDFDSKEAEYGELLLDGKIAEASQLRKEIRAAERADWDADNASTTKDAIEATTTQNEMTNLSEQAQNMYPVFDPKHDDFDQRLVTRVMSYYKGYVATGEAANHGDAFVMALADVITAEKLDDKYAGPAEGEEEKPAAKPDGKISKRAQKDALKKKSHVPTADKGDGSDAHGAVVPDIETMSDEDFDALPDSVQAKMRGDVM